MKMTILKRMPLVLLLVVVLVLEGIKTVQAGQLYVFVKMEKGDNTASTKGITFPAYIYDLYLRGMCYTGNIRCSLEYHDFEGSLWLEFPGTAFFVSEPNVIEKYINTSGNAQEVRGKIKADSLFKWLDSGTVSVRIPY